MQQYETGCTHTTEAIYCGSDPWPRVWQTPDGKTVCLECVREAASAGDGEAQAIWTALDRARREQAEHWRFVNLHLCRNLGQLPGPRPLSEEELAAVRADMQWWWGFYQRNPPQYLSWAE